MKEFTSYPKIASLGSKGFEEIFNVPVFIQEKLDGSNVSIHKINGKICLASRSQWIDNKSPENSGMFKLFVKWAEDNKELLKYIPESASLWGEFCNNHNVLKYEAKHPFVLFDISIKPVVAFSGNDFGIREFLNPITWASKFDIKFFSTFFNIPYDKEQIILLNTQKEFLSFLNLPSILGGRREGIVLKNYTNLNRFMQPLFCKVVNEEFKEKASKGHPDFNKPDIESELATNLYLSARLTKAIQRLQEENRYQGSPKDIGALIGLVCRDIHDEEKENIKEILFKYHWKQIARMITAKIPNDYKQRLIEDIKNV
jgi:hypothetical protein